MSQIYGKVQVEIRKREPGAWHTVGAPLFLTPPYSQGSPTLSLSPSFPRLPYSPAHLTPFQGMFGENTSGDTRVSGTGYATLCSYFLETPRGRQVFGYLSSVLVTILGSGHEFLS